MVRVVSCRFMRLSCSEAEHPLFRRYYARSNRERGVKLLRCFPHCCPEHVQRCYCGSSVHVMVMFAAELLPASHGSLLVCARFEPSRVVPLWPTNVPVADPPQEDPHQDHERKLQPGEMVALPASLLTGGRQAKQTHWIRADREGEPKQTTKNATLYVLNNHRFPKWLYSYDSSVTRTQREMTHHLVVYVFQLTGARSQHGEVEAAVLARHESPGFTLISYRRSGNNSSDAGCDLPAVEAAPDSKFAAVQVDSPEVEPARSDDVEMGPYDRDASELSPVDTNRTFTLEQHADHRYNEQWRQQQQMLRRMQRQRWRLEQPDRVRSVPRAPANSRDRVHGGLYLGAIDSVNDQYLWQKEAGICEPAFRERAQHLLILWRFIQRVSLSDLKFSADTIESHVHSHWLRAAAALRSPSISFSADLERVVASFLSNVFDHRPAHKPNTNTHSDRDQATVRTSVHLFLCALSSRTVQRLLREACQVGDGASNKQWLQERFVSLVLDLYDILGGVLREVSASAGVVAGGQPTSVPALVDNVLSLIYGRTHFNALREETSALLLDRQTPNALSDALNHAFYVFSAQAHESMLVLRQQQDPRPESWSSENGDTSQSLWNNRWLLDPGSVRYNSLEDGAKHDARDALDLIAVAQFIREFGCIDITIERGRMSLRTALSFDGAMAISPMELVLDGRSRGFNVLPSGISTGIAAAGGWSIGDYQTMPSDDCQCLNLRFFAFKEEAKGSNNPSGTPGTMVCRISLSLVLEQDLGADESMDEAYPRDVFVVVHGTVCGSTYRRPSCGVELCKMSSADRSVIWNTLKWTPVVEVQTGYVAI
ncbi:hypothetical protein PF003_g26666 [Phytophthora fragariae]|nr:hypothetical protein PF003_g26666 [Phytophthora fragariae]